MIEHKRLADVGFQGGTFSPVCFVKHVLYFSALNRASDVHFESCRDRFQVRMRVDGALQQVVDLDVSLADRVLAHMKILSKMDVAEKRVPQDGRFDFFCKGLARECRVSVCPGMHGERLVVRFLECDAHFLCLDQLGFSTDQRTCFLKYIGRSHGMILIAGPTGSGKTRTIYSALHALNDGSKNIMTAEDPVEVKLQGIHQVSINKKSGMNYSTILRAFLRQDPDVIVVGEIRDAETASLSIRAAQTGHLMFSTIHAADSIEVLLRLRHLGVPGFHLASALTLVVSQRLKRKKQGGREGVFDLLPITSEIKKLVMEDASSEQFRRSITGRGCLDG